MKGVILAAGRGTRLRPVTLEIPKPLVPVQKQPIASHLVQLFLSHGVGDIRIIINQEHQNDFEAWHSNQLSQDAQNRVQLLVERDRTGTFGPLYLHLRDWIDSDVVVSNGDELKDINLTTFSNFHRQKKALATIGLVKVPNPQDYGVAIINKSDQIDTFIEKPSSPPSSYINSGIYLLSPDILKYFPPHASFAMLEKDLFPTLAKQGDLYGFKWSGHWYDCGTLERWEDAINKWPHKPSLSSTH